MKPAQESNHFSPGAKAEPHTSPPPLNTRNAAEYPGRGDRAIVRPGIIPFDKKQFASSSDNPVNDQTVIRSFCKCRDVPGMKIRRTERRNGYHVPVFYERAHAAAACPESETRAPLEHIAQEFRQIRRRQTEFRNIFTENNHGLPVLISTGIFRLIVEPPKPALPTV